MLKNLPGLRGLDQSNLPASGQEFDQKKLLGGGIDQFLEICQGNTCN